MDCKIVNLFIAVWRLTNRDGGGVSAVDAQHTVAHVQQAGASCSGFDFVDEQTSVRARKAAKRKAEAVANIVGHVDAAQMTCVVHNSFLLG